MSHPAHTRLLGLALVLPALATVALFFLYPLGFSAASAFSTPAGWGLANFTKAFELYTTDILFTLIIVALSTVLIGLCAIAIGGYITLGENPTAISILRWLYRWPLFIPFIVAGQLMRTFLAKNGMMNNALVGLGVLTPAETISLLDWRGIVITLVWKETPFVALLAAGAMGSLDRGMI